MLRIVGYTVFLYVVLKLCRLLVRPAAAVRDDDVGLWTVIRAGEPMLLAGTAGFAVLTILYTTWWGHRFNEGQYSYSADCYARMAASHHLPGRPARFGSYRAGEAATGHFRFAEIHGAQLGIGKDVIDRKLDRARTAYSEYYSALAAKSSVQEVAASIDGLDRCLKGEGAPRGELLMPNV